MKKIFNRNNLIIITILLIAIILRLYNLSSRTSFNADQEWLAFRASEVLKGDIAFIGPVTSVGGFSIGPYFIYLLAIVSLFFGGGAISGAYLSVLLGILTIFSIYLFTKYYIDKNVSLVVLFLLAISSQLIFWDQNPWAPSLFFLSQMVLLWGAYISKKDKLGYPLMALGLVMGFSSHFGIMLSLFSIIIYLLIVWPVRISIKYLLFTIGILLIGFSPNILFDITHNFINLKRIVGIVGGDGLDYFVSFGKIISVLSYNTISPIYPKNMNLIDSVIIKSLFALVVANGIKNLRNKKYKSLSLLLLITIIFPSAFFYIQQGKFSEYYLMMTVPSSILLLTLTLKDLINRRLIIIAILILSTYLNYKYILNRYIPWNLRAKENIAKTMIQKSGKEGYGISLTTKYGDQYGFNYIFYNHKIKSEMPPKKGETRIFSIIIPEGFEGMTGMTDFDGIGLRWQGI